MRDTCYLSFFYYMAWGMSGQGEYSRTSYLYDTKAKFIGHVFIILIIFPLLVHHYQKSPWYMVLFEIEDIASLTLLYRRIKNKLRLRVLCVKHSTWVFWRATCIWMQSFCAQFVIKIPCISYHMCIIGWSGWWSIGMCGGIKSKLSAQDNLSLSQNYWWLGIWYGGVVVIADQLWIIYV